MESFLLCSYLHHTTTLPSAAQKASNHKKAPAPLQNAASPRFLDGIWGNAEDYLQFVSKINAGKKISEEMGNAMRELYNIALKYNPNVLDMFKGFFTEKPFNFVFKSCGRPRKKQWLNKLVSTMKAEYTKSEVYRNAKPYHKDLFRQFLWEVVNTTDYNNDYANVI